MKSLGEFFIPPNSYFLLTKFAYACGIPLGQRGEPPQRNFALLFTYDSIALISRANFARLYMMLFDPI